VLYDFGKIKSAVNIEQAKLLEEQANVLVSIDDIAYQTANAIVNINRYREIVKIAHQQIQGIARIAEIANLRAQAGISSQADPVQAQ
ncbi:TolC family protein, partial [Acinetobacter baumannii]